MNTYDGVEDLRLFPTEQRLKDYRHYLLRKTYKQTCFIENRILPLVGRDRLSVVEVGTGNGRLLISLSIADLLDIGYGIDVSESRIEFANAWYKSLYYSRPIRFKVDDVLTAQHSPHADLAVCITGCFNYFRSISIDAPLTALKYMRNAANYALFELYKMPPKIKDRALAGEWVRMWDYLADEDPWIYYLHGWLWDTDLRIMTHDKTFIGPNGLIDNTRTEQLYYYDHWEFDELLREAGFSRILYDREDDECRVILVN